MSEAHTEAAEQAVEEQNGFEAELPEVTGWRRLLASSTVWILTILIGIIVVFSILQTADFASSSNIRNIATDASVLLILSVGATYVIVTAGIDLSVGSVLVFAGVVSAKAMNGVGGNGWGVLILGLVVALAGGLAWGMINGFLITLARVPPFVVTLGGMSAFRGAALLFSDGGPISGFDPDFVWWGQGKILGQVPVPVLVFLAFAVLGHVVLRYTRYGRQVYAVGGNAEAARLSGLNVRAVVTSVYVIMGFFAGLGSFVQAARLNSAEAVAGVGIELTVIASVVIGGTSLFGGVGTIFGTVVGTVLIGVLLNGLVLMNVSTYVQQIIIGIIIVLAVAFDTFAKSRKRSG
jgi:ribose/xylose/arabinose/galactoside ABC-type transport system permease subunit